MAKIPTNTQTTKIKQQNPKVTLTLNVNNFNLYN